MPLKKGDLAFFGKIGRVGVPPKIGRLTIYGGELTGMKGVTKSKAQTLCNNTKMLCCSISVTVFTCFHVLTNRAYPENANFKTCAPSTLKFYTFFGLHETKNC